MIIKIITISEKKHCIKIENNMAEKTKIEEQISASIDQALDEIFFDM